MLRTFISRPAALLAVLALLCWSPAARGQGEKPGGEKPAGKDEVAKKLTTSEQIQEALGKTVTLEYSGQSLQDVLLHITKKTGVAFSVDTNSTGYPAMGGGFGFAGGPAGGFGPGPMGGVGGMPGMPGASSLKIQNTTLGKGLKQFLQKKNLTFAVMGSKVVVGSDQQILAQQMKQVVDVDVNKVALPKALQDLAKTTGANILIDPAAQKAGDAEVTLKLDGISLEMAVRLLAFSGGMKAVRVDNLLVITTPERAALLPHETPLPPGAPANFQDVVDHGSGVPGFPGFGPGAIPPGGVPMPGFPGGGAPGNPGAVPPPAGGINPPMALPTPALPPNPEKIGEKK